MTKTSIDSSRETSTISVTAICMTSLRQHNLISSTSTRTHDMMPKADPVRASVLPHPDTGYRPAGEDRGKCPQCSLLTPPSLSRPGKQKSERGAVSSTPSAFYLCERTAVQETRGREIRRSAKATHVWHDQKTKLMQREHVTVSVVVLQDLKCLAGVALRGKPCQQSSLPQPGHEGTGPTTRQPRVMCHRHPLLVRQSTPQTRHTANTKAWHGSSLPMSPDQMSSQNAQRGLPLAWHKNSSGSTSSGISSAPLAASASLSQRSGSATNAACAWWIRLCQFSGPEAIQQSHACRARSSSTGGRSSRLGVNNACTICNPPCAKGTWRLQRSAQRWPSRHNQPSQQKDASQLNQRACRRELQCSQNRHIRSSVAAFLPRASNNDASQRLHQCAVNAPPLCRHNESRLLASWKNAWKKQKPAPVEPVSRKAGHGVRGSVCTGRHWPPCQNCSAVPYSEPVVRAPKTHTPICL